MSSWTQRDGKRQLSSLSSAPPDLPLLTPPCLTYLKDNFDGIVYRGPGRSGHDGIGKPRGEVKQRIRTDNLCLKRCCEAFQKAVEVNLAVALILPYGNHLVFNPAAHSIVYTKITGEVEFTHVNIEEKDGSGLAVFSNAPPIEVTGSDFRERVKNLVKLLRIGAKWVSSCAGKAFVPELDVHRGARPLTPGVWTCLGIFRPRR